MAKRKPDRAALLARLGYEVNNEIAGMLRKANKTNKYGAKRVGNHASKKEHYRARQLLVMERAGLISDLREQVSYELIPPQRDDKGKLIERSCRYIADFVYTDAEGRTVVEDTKGVRTPGYIIKRKLMLWIHGIRITEI